MNNVTIKILTSDVISTDESSGGRVREEYFEQKFKITVDTTFKKLRDEACTFFGFDPVKDAEKIDLYSLMLPNRHDIMCLNDSETHMAHTVCKYFEITRAKKTVMFLMKPDRNRT